MDTSDNKKAGRRDFLKVMGLAGAGAAATAATAVVGEAQADETPEEQIKARYRLTEHVKRFYFLNSL